MTEIKSFNTEQEEQAKTNSLIEECLENSSIIEDNIQYFSSPKVNIGSMIPKKKMIRRNFTPKHLKSCFISNIVTVNFILDNGDSKPIKLFEQNSHTKNLNLKKMIIEDEKKNSELQKNNNLSPNNNQDKFNTPSKSSQILKKIPDAKNFNQKFKEALLEEKANMKNRIKLSKKYLTPKHKMKNSSSNKKKSSAFDCQMSLKNARNYFKEQKINSRENKETKIIIKNRNFLEKCKNSYIYTKNSKSKTKMLSTKKNNYSFTKYFDATKEMEKIKRKNNSKKKTKIFHLLTRQKSTSEKDKQKTVERIKLNLQVKKSLKKVPSSIITSYKPRNSIIEINELKKRNSLIDDIKNNINFFTNTEKEAKLEQEYIENCLRIIKNLKIEEQPRCKSSVNLNLPKMCNKKIALFDLDETLIHCVGQITPGNPKNLKYDISTNVILPTKKEVLIGINIRPDWEKALDFIKDKYHIIIYTASHQSYADSVLKVLDPQNKYFQYRLYRNNCVQCDVDGTKFYVKDLDSLKKYYDLKNVVLIDNSVLSFAYHLYNGIPIVPYYDSKTDQELMLVAYYLKTIADIDDLRIDIKKRFDIDFYLKKVDEEEEEESEGDIEIPCQEISRNKKKSSKKIGTVIEENTEELKNNIVNSDKNLLRKISLGMGDLNKNSALEKSNINKLKKPIKKFVSVNSNLGNNSRKFKAFCDLYSKININ